MNLDGPLEEQIERWRPGSLPFLASAQALAAHEVEALGPIPEGSPELRAFLFHQLALLGYQVRMLPQARVPEGLRLRAWLDVRGKTLELYRESVLQLAERLGPEEQDKALCLVLAHELFHALSPHCSGLLAELGAHLFAARSCSLKFFPGLLDVGE